MTRRFSQSGSAILVLAGSLAAAGGARLRAEGEGPSVTAPPESFFELVSPRDRHAARAFYRKHLDVRGMPVAASAEVADLALERTRDIVLHLLAGRPDALEAMVKDRMYLIVIGKDQVYTDMPEYRTTPTPPTRTSACGARAGGPQA